MSILSNFAAEPNRLEMLVNFLRSENKTYTRSELEDLFSPKSGRGESSVFKEVYSVANSLDIFEFEEQESGSSRISIKKELKNQSLINYLENKIFEKEFVLQDSLSFAISWLLIQNPKYPIDWSDNISTRIAKDLNNEFGELELTNNSRSQHFIYWCQYLGFSQKVSIGTKTFVIPDPTNIIFRHVSNIFSDTNELKIGDFIKKLSSKLPVFEDGWIRELVEDKAKEGLERNEQFISYSTSLALLRLEEKGSITLLSKSDADVMPFSGVENRRITHIQYLGAKK